MKAVKLHTIRFLFVFLIWTGMFLSLIQPLRAEYTTRSFTKWLNTVVKKQNDKILIKQIEELEKSQAGILHLVEQASIIISRNNDHFNLPLPDKETDKEKIYHLLLTEWDYFHIGKATAKAPLPESVKINFLTTVQGDKVPTSSIYSIPAKEIPAIEYAGYIKMAELQNNGISYNTSPLSGGSAIGAP